MKHNLYKLYTKLGLVLYPLVLPLARIFLRRSQRAYILFYDQGQVLLVKNWLSTDEWLLPGGGIRSNESPESAALREVHEELGLQVKAQLSLLYSGHWQTDNLGFHYYIYLAEQNFDTIKRRKLEITEVKFVSVQELNSINIKPEALHCINKLLKEH
jgi:8-oxo-dGTP pyrophosphatase MutT (NUDIX family)